MKSFPEKLPRWQGRQTFRRALQRGSGAVLLVGSVAGAYFWWQRLQPLPQAGPMAGILLLGVLPALWMLLDSPARREQRPEELAVFNKKALSPFMTVELLVLLFFWLLAPRALLEEPDPAAALAGRLPTLGIFLLVMVMLAYYLVASGNELLLLSPDGSAEWWDVLGRHHRTEAFPVAVRIRPALARYYVCDGAGNTLYHFGHGMVNEVALLDWLEAQKVAGTGEETRRRMGLPTPRTCRVLDWTEEDRTPVHRWLPLLRLFAWLTPPVALLAQWWLLVYGLGLLGLRPASLLACWLPLVFFGAYLVWPRIFVWKHYPRRPRLSSRRQVVATPAWRQMHVGLGGAFLPVVGALLWAVAESMAFLVGRPERMALLCVALAVLLVLLCEIRRPRPLTRGRGTVLVLAALMAFPMGFGLNLALTRKAYPDQGTVMEVQPPEPGQNYASLTFRWEGRRYTATWYGAVSDLPQPEEAVDLCIRESPLGIHIISVNC